MSIKALSSSQALNKLSDAYHKAAEIHPELVYYAKMASVAIAGIGAVVGAVKYFNIFQHRKVTQMEVYRPNGDLLIKVMVAEETTYHRAIGDRQWDVLPLQDRATKRPRNAGLLE